MNSVKICVSVCADTTSEMIEKIERAAVVADLIEIRFDCLPSLELRASEGPSGAVNLIISRFPDLKFLVTLRSRAEGGRREITEKERFAFWNSGFSAEMVDFERDIADTEFSSEWKSKIVSAHLKTAEEIPASLQNSAADIVKVALPVSECTTGLEVWKLLNDANFNTDSRQVVPIAMGEAGKWTRILGPAFGAPIAYAALNSKEQTAGGQIPAADLREVYRVTELNRSTEIYGLLGNPVSHSVSPFLHNAAFKEISLNAVYIPFEVRNLKEFFKRMVNPRTREIDWNLQGFSVTAPHKQEIIQELDFVDEVAGAIGSVNTVKIIENQFVGMNTDAAGFIEPLKGAFGSLKGQKVALIGAGGAARACVYALQKAGAQPTVFARNVETGQAVADRFGCGIELLSDDENLFDAYSIAVNATPLGTLGGLQEMTPIASLQMKNLQLVYDLVYNPYETLLIREAAKAGVPTISGIEMLVSQASKQFELWTGRKAPVREMSRAALTRLS